MSELRSVVMKSRLLRQLVVSLFLIITVTPLSALAEPSATTQPLAEQKAVAARIRDLLFQRDYAAAKQGLEEMLQRWPEDVIGYAGMLVFYQLRNVENFDMRFDKEVEKWIEPGRERALAVLNNQEADSWHLYLAGGTLSMTGFYYFRNGQTFRALGDGLRGIHALERAYEIDPNNVDPLLGIGAYNYWRSVYTRKFSILPFFPDKRQVGIEMLEQAHKRGSFTKELAQGSLSWIYFNEGDFGKAYKYNEELFKKYPDNVIVRTLKGLLLTQLKRYTEADEQFAAILKIDPSLSSIYLYQAFAEFDEVDTKYRPRGEVYQGITPEESAAYNQVIPTIEKFLAMEPAPRMKARGYDLWAEILFRQGNIKEAKKKTKTALHLDYSLSSARGRQQQLRQ